MFIFNKRLCYGSGQQNSAFRIERENSLIIDHIKPATTLTTTSETSCLMTCMNYDHEDLCCHLVSIKFIHKNEYGCSIYTSIEIIKYDKNLREESHSFIYSIVDRDCQQPRLEAKPRDCLDWYNKGFTTDGIYTIVIKNDTQRILCDMSIHGGGWTVFQRRFDGSLSFDRTWHDYKHGFGDPTTGEYWSGNEFIHQMANGTAPVLLKLNATDFLGNSRYIILKDFWIEDEGQKYRVHSGELFHGEPALASDWIYHNGMCFTTKDSDNDTGPNNCAQTHAGGWWYENCLLVCPNTRYSSTGLGMQWRSFSDKMKTFTMALRRAQ